jgi:hypothetical protein
MSKADALRGLEILTSRKTISIDQLFPDPIFQTPYQPVVQYIESLAAGTKQETASHDFFRDFVRDVFPNVTAHHEVVAKRGFVDFVLIESNSNPIFFELKPLFILNKTDRRLDAEVLSWKDHGDQVRKYLRSNEYVLLSDLKEVYLFNRMALVEYEPFEHLSFQDLTNRFLASENLADALRRIEDQTVKIDLDKSFFEDLKEWYNAFEKVEFDATPARRTELIVLLLNKLVFIKTLEDFNLVGFQFLLDEYEKNKDKWIQKGPERSLRQFFNDIEMFFEENYDTELFTTNVWQYVVKSEKNVRLFQDNFEAMLGVGRWKRTFSQGLTHYNYRLIDEDIFGKAYETFIAENRKDEGIYYTPKSITAYMAKKLVESLFEPVVDEVMAALDKNNLQFDIAVKAMERLERIKILDPASGSGSFLIKALREIYLQYGKIIEATDWVVRMEKENLFDAPTNYRETVEFRALFRLKRDQQIEHIARVVLLHIFAIDKDERALDTAKANIWKEAVKLNPRQYNWRRLEGISHILPNLSMNCVAGDSLQEVAIEEQLQVLAEHSDKIAELQRIRKEYIDNPFEPKVLDGLQPIKKELHDILSTALPDPKNQLFVALECWTAFFDSNGNALPSAAQGFDGAISNPPWEAIKPVQKEYAKIPKGSRDILNFSNYFKEKIQSDEEFRNGWRDYQDFYRRYTDFLFSRYTHQGKGDPNYYKFFLERDLELIRRDGHLAILVPSGFQTDVGCKSLRELAVFENSFEEIASFENRGYETEIKEKPKRVKLFPEVHPQFKFSILLIQKRKPKKKSIFDGRFYLQKPSDLDNVKPLRYSPVMIEKFSPINLGIMEFRNEDDARICHKIRDEHSLIKDLDLRFYTEIHMTNANRLFIPSTSKDSKKSSALAVFEGKMIHQYRADFEAPRFFIDREAGEEEVRRKLAARVKRLAKLEAEPNPASLKIDLDEFRLGIRDVGASTNERSILASLIPRNVFVGNTINYLINYRFAEKKGKLSQELIPRDDLLYLLAVLNSLTLNFYIRNKISSHVSISFLYEMPVPSAEKNIRSQIVNLSRQIVLANDSQNYFSELGKKPAKSFDAIQARAEIEVLIAKDVYGLSFDDWKYLTSTFVQGESETKVELDSIIRQSLFNYSKENS